MDFLHGPCKCTATNVTVVSGCAQCVFACVWKVSNVIILLFVMSIHCIPITLLFTESVLNVKRYIFLSYITTKYISLTCSNWESSLYNCCSEVWYTGASIVECGIQVPVSWSVVYRCQYCGVWYTGASIVECGIQVPVSWSVVYRCQYRGVWYTGDRSASIMECGIWVPVLWSVVHRCQYCGV